MSGSTPIRPPVPPPGTPRSLSCSDAELLFAQTSDRSSNQAADNTLDPASQAALDAHLATCPACTASLAMAQRGQAWLAILRDSDVHPEPPAGMVENILALTGGQPLGTVGDIAPVAPRKPSPWSSVNLAAVRGNMRRTGLFEPRLMLTAAMAFFSISITLSVMGIHLNDLEPTHLRRTVTRSYFTANAHVVRYYENLRVVYELQSRLSELRHAAEAARPAPATTQPAQPQPGQPQSGQPQSGQPQSGQPQSDKPGSSNPGSSNQQPSHPASHADDGVAHKDKHSQSRQPGPDNSQPRSAPANPFSGDLIEAAFFNPQAFTAGVSNSGASIFGKNLSLRSSRRRASVVPQVALCAQRSQA
jgi:hypothetical protein